MWAFRALNRTTQVRRAYAEVDVSRTVMDRRANSSITHTMSSAVASQSPRPCHAEEGAG